MTSTYPDEDTFSPTPDTAVESARHAAGDTGADSSADSGADVVDLVRARARARTGDADSVDTQPATDLDPDTRPDTCNSETRTAGAETSPGNAQDNEVDGDADGEADDQDAARVVLVDSPHLSGPVSSPLSGGVSGWRSVERRPLLPAWLRSWSEFVEQLGWSIGLVWHLSLYHTLRIPKYGFRLLTRSPRGLGRLMRSWWRWMWDLEGELLRQAMATNANKATREDIDAYLRLTRQRNNRVRFRSIVSAAAVPVLSAAAVLVGLFAPGRVLWPVAVMAVVACGVVGRPADKPLLDTAVVKPRFRVLTSEAILRALLALGIGQLSSAIGKDPRSVGFVAPITRDGPGYRADIDLPDGVTAEEVADKRDKLAAALKRPLSCVWPEGDPDIDPGRLVLWVGDQPLRNAKAPHWPLEKTGTVDLFKPFPFGTDQRGRTVTLTLMFALLVIGSIPRMGKTFTGRLLALACGLDVRAEMHLYDLKGMGDLSPLQQIAHRYRAGAEDDDIAYLLADTEAMVTDLQRRAKVLRSLPLDRCPEGKITPELASDRKLGLHPVFFWVDECQMGFEHPAHGKQIQANCEIIGRLGPAAGYIPLYSTQRPNKEALPTGISANAAIRFCLKVMGQVENDMVLGTSKYKQGIRATLFSRKDLGIGYLVGEGDDPRIVRSYFLDGPAARAVAARARLLRERANRLTGHALGDHPAPDTQAQQARRLLDDILAVCPPSEGTGKFWTEIVLDRLKDHHPGAYGDWSTDQLATALRAQGVATRQVWKKLTDGETGSPNRAGINTHEVAEIVAERNRIREADTTP